ncbi:MAG: 16S rRNA (guanine(527)-N(7))-methyltransferase RsmG [Bacteroidota bacterium]|nr:16S rRNA (guanine(527)-N(7))-methyltransferase RsmG [Bacteroidota bacterium]
MSINLIYKYFPNLNLESNKKIEQLYLLYKNYNDKINLISRKDFHLFYERHVLHSLSISKFVQFKKNHDVMDLGTGGGFPGLPLAILFPDTNFYLVDSIKKKTDCVSKIINDLKIKNVEVVNSRSENLNNKFDFIITRAVAPLSKLDILTRGQFKNLSNGGLICLKGGDLSDELNGFENRTQLVEISSYFEEDFFKTKKIVFLK